MTIEKNWCDDWLKKRLWRDIFFRLIVLALITTSTLFFATNSSDFSALIYLQKTAETIGPVLNSVGVGALFMAIIALMFKDLESQSPEWSQQTKRGKAGATIRRLASDLMLWLLGIFGTLLCITVFATVDLWKKNGVSAIESLQLSYIYGFFVLAMFVAAAFNILVRRPDPPLAKSNLWISVMHSPTRTILFYLIGMSILTACVLFGT